MPDYQNLIEETLKKENVIFEKKNSLFFTFWRIIQTDFVIVVSFFDDWLNFTCTLPIKKQKITKDQILHFNFKYLGLKLIMDNDDSIVIANQLPINTINLIDFPKIFSSILHAINDLNFDE